MGTKCSGLRGRRGKEMTSRGDDETETRDRKGEMRPQAEAGGEDEVAVTSHSSFQIILMKSLLTLQSRTDASELNFGIEVGFRLKEATCQG